MWSRLVNASVRNAGQLLLYLWASPGTVAGLGLCLLAVLSGGRVRRVGRILECYGGAVTRILGCGRLPCIGSARGMALGHVVAGTDDKTLQMIREHELVHVRQYERWGPAFIPAYLGSSLWIGLRGGNPYRDNPFEKEAYAVSDGRLS